MNTSQLKISRRRKKFGEISGVEKRHVSSLAVKSSPVCAHVCGRNSGDIDRRATFTKGECLSTLSSPSSAFASRGGKNSGRESKGRERERGREKECEVRHVSLRSRSHSHDNGAPAEPVAFYCFAGSRSLNDAHFST